ncbi:MAG: TraU family protein [Burkholderiales bacterium]|nr:TraU family protein [Burkholderiales bacterium]
MKKLIRVCLFLIISKLSFATCSGTFVNPITDVCWSCMFPIYISPLPVKWGYAGQKGKVVTEQKSIQDSYLHSLQVLPLGMCHCSGRGLVLLGVLMSWYEPYRSVDVTKNPFCLTGLGGLDLGAGLSDLLPSAGYGDEVHGMQTRSSFYQVHWYLDPILEMLEILDVGCTLGQTVSIDLLFLSEVDPAWNDDDISFIFSPEVVLFTSMPAQLACATDCISASLPYRPSPISFADNITYSRSDNDPANTSSASNPSKYLYWCGGCQGSLFPLDGNNIDAMHEVQTTILSAEKANMLIHRMGLEMSTTSITGMCRNIIPDMFMDKSEWKYSMTFPKPQGLSPGTCCNAFGETDSTWNSGASYPVKGENFNYLWYHERDCCYF